ncbi:MAG: hypothetical protein RR014_04605, partial [Bilophila sp.]
RSSLLPSLLALLLTLTMLALLTACGPSNSVKLIYSPGPNSVLPQPEAPRVTVVMFDDQRTNQNIGERKDGSAFTPSSLVADWVGRSLGDEIGRQGSQVSYATTMGQAKSANPEYIVSGVVREVWIKENSSTSLTATIRIAVTVSNRKGVVYSENLSSSQERQALPMSSVADKLLSDTLRDLLVPAAKKIQQQLR